MAASPSSHLRDLGLSVVVSRRSWLRAPVSVRSVLGAQRARCIFVHLSSLSPNTNLLICMLQASSGCVLQVCASWYAWTNCLLDRM